MIFFTLQEIQEALASVDIINDNDLDADNSHDYEPEIENLGTPHPLEKEFADSLDFAERFQLSDFVVSNMTNLIGKAYGVKDPSLLVTETCIGKMKKRRRKACLEDHKVKTKRLIGLQVNTFMRFEATTFSLS